MPHDLPAAVFEHPLLAGHDWTLKRRTTGRHTDLMEFLDEGRDVRIFVKRLHDSGNGGTDTRLRRECRALRVLQSRLGPEMVQSLPVPLGAHDNDSVLVVTGVAGVPLARVLMREANWLTGPVRMRRLKAVGTAAGDWLRRFHDATSRTPMPHDHDRFCHGLARALHRLGARAGTEGLAELQAQLTRASGQLDGVLLETAAGHGDFLPQNILVQRDRVAVVDFEGYRPRQAVHRDVGHMLAYSMMLERQRRYHGGALRAFANAFAHAYGARPNAAAQRLFTAEGSVRIARDSAHPRTRRIMLTTVATLLRVQEPEQDA